MQTVEYIKKLTKSEPTTINNRRSPNRPSHEQMDEVISHVPLFHTGPMAIVNKEGSGHANNAWLQVTGKSRFCSV